MSSEHDESGLDKQDDDLRLARTYSDLLSSEPDAQLRHVVANLDLLHNTRTAPEALYQVRPWLEDPSASLRPILASSDLPDHSVPSRDAQTVAQQHRPATRPGALGTQRRFMPGLSDAISRLGRIGAAAVAVVLLVGFSFLLSTSLKGQNTLRQASQTATAEAIAKNPSGDLLVLDSTSALSQTINGYTVTIGPLPIYARSADANAIFLPYRVNNWQGYQFTESAARLLDANGQGGPIVVADTTQTLRWLGTTTVHPNVPGGRTAAASTSALVFDATSLPPGQSEHILELTLNFRIYDIYPPAPGSNVPALGTSPSGTVSPNQVVAGPFVFRFRLSFEPFHSAADVGQTVTAGGVPITLQRVIAVPSEARVLLSFTSPNGQPAIGWQPTDVLLSGQGIERSVVEPLGSALWSEPDGHGGQVNGWLDDRTWVGSALDYLGSEDFRDGGQWTLVIGALENSGSEGGGVFQRIEGPWTFQFTMPPFAPLPTPVTNVTYAPTVEVPTQPAPAPQASHEPFPTVPLPGPVETGEARSVAPGQHTEDPPPVPIETVQANQTMMAMYPTVIAAVTATSAAQPTPPGTSDTPLRPVNLRRLTLHSDLVAANLNALNPPALSPNGDSLLVSTRDHKLLLAPLDGGPPLQLADDVAQYAWSSDGRYVVYLHMEPMGSPSYILVPYSVTADGQARHKLDFPSNVYTVPEVARDNTWEIRWTPRPGLWSIPLDGSPSEFVVSVPDAQYQAGVRITSDGKRMAYLCRGGVCLQDMDGSHWRKLLTQPYSLAWSRDGSMLAVTTMHNLLLYDRDGTMKAGPQYSMLPTQGISGISQDALTLEWTADSRYLLIYLGRPPYDGRQSFIEMDTATGYAWGGLAPEWAKSFSISPDGKQLVLRGEAAEFWMADLLPDKQPTTP